MTDQRRESVSALMDGECSEFEARRLLRDLATDPALRKDWDDMARARALLHADSTAWAGVDISARVREAVTGEAMALSRWQRMARPVAGAAIAAAVAGIVVMGASWMGSRQGAPEAVPAVAVAVPAQPVQAVDAAVHTVSTGSAVPAAAEPLASEVARVDASRFEGYVQRHAEYSSLNSHNGLMPYARVASFETAGK